MQKVILVGELAQFGSEWDVKCAHLADIFKLISCQTPGFRKFLIDSEEAGLDIEIIKGGDLIVDPRELLISLRSEDIVMTLCPAGEKSKGLRILTAVVLFTMGYYDVGGFGSIFTGMAVNMTLSVVSEMMAPGPESGNPANTIDGEEVGDKLFNGPVNVSKNGTPMPLLYGELIVGGATISAEFYQLPGEQVATVDVIEPSIQDATVALF